MQLSIFSLAELPASHSASPDSERDWMIRVATSCLPILPSLAAIGPAGWFGRTSPASYPVGGGRDFAAFLRGLDELGYGWAYRVLDAQYFGVAQRRRRVFVVGHLGNWRRAAAVLFERHSLQGHPAPRREAGKGAASAVAECLRAGGNATGGDRPSGTDVDTAGTYLLPVPHADISPAIKARDSKGVSSDGDGDGAILVPMVSHALRGEGFDASEDGTGRGTPLVPVAFDTTQITSKGNFSNPQPGDPCHPFAFCGSQDPDVSGDVTPPIGRNQGQETCIAFNPVQEGMGLSSVAAPLGASVGGGNQGAVATTMHVRRLTPRECERLQGFKDDYTLIPWRGKSADQCPDGPRYKALGNSMAVPGMHWIGRRIQMVEEIE